MKTTREQREKMRAILRMKSATEGLKNYVNAICDDANLCEDAIKALRALMDGHHVVMEQMPQDLQRALMRLDASQREKSQPRSHLLQTVRLTRDPARLHAAPIEELVSAAATCAKALVKVAEATGHLEQRASAFHVIDRAGRVLGRELRRRKPNMDH